MLPLAVAILGSISAWDTCPGLPMLNLRCLMKDSHGWADGWVCVGDGFLG